MNKIHRIVWNAATGTWAAVPECANSHGKGGAVSVAGLALAAALTIGSASALAAPPNNQQLPTGGQVVAGSASISQSGAALTVQQNSQRAALDWQTFNIGSQARVHFAQPTGGVALNRIADSNPSQIYGQLSATGQVFLSNPNGLYFAPGASVNVGGLVATTHRISVADFMAGKTTFERKGASGSVLNEGELKAALGGYIALLAPEVRNQGVIVANLGTVALAAGETFELQFDANNSLAALRVTPSTIQAVVDNKSAVLAPGGLIILSAQAVDRVRAGVIKNSGRLEATGLQQRGGRMVLDASDAIENTGSIAAVAGADGPAGSVQLTAPTVTNAGDIRAHSITIAAGDVVQTSSGVMQASSGIAAVNAAVDAAVHAAGIAAHSAAGSISVQASGKVALEGMLDVSAPSVGTAASSQAGGQITVRAAQIDVNNAQLNASGSSGGSITLDVGSRTAAANNSPATPSLPSAPTAPLPAPEPGKLALTGTTHIASRGRRGTGGSVTLLGDHLSLNDTTAIDATGATGGGTVRVGGGWQGSGGYYQATTVTMAKGALIDVSATQTGTGGTAVLWSDVHKDGALTQAHGTVLAKGGVLGGDGGKVETSGHRVDIDGFGVNTLPAGDAPGRAGLWLIDPVNYTIGATEASTIGTALNTSSVTVTTTADVASYGSDGNTAGNGAISVTSAITKTSGTRTTLTLQAHDRVMVGAPVSGSSGSPLDLVLWANYGAARGVGVSIGAAINTFGGHLWAGGSSTNGGSLTWNGLAVGNGPSVGSINGNNIAFDFNGNITTGEHGRCHYQHQRQRQAQHRAVGRLRQHHGLWRQRHSHHHHQRRPRLGGWQQHGQWQQHLERFEGGRRPGPG